MTAINANSAIISVAADFDRQFMNAEFCCKIECNYDRARLGVTLATSEYDVAAEILAACGIDPEAFACAMRGARVEADITESYIKGLRDAADAAETLGNEPLAENIYKLASDARELAHEQNPCAQVCAWAALKCIKAHTIALELGLDIAEDIDLAVVRNVIASQALTYACRAVDEDTAQKVDTAFHAACKAVALTAPRVTEVDSYAFGRCARYVAMRAAEAACFRAI